MSLPPANRSPLASSISTTSPDPVLVPKRTRVRRHPLDTGLDRLRRSRSLALTTLLTTIFSIVAPLIPKTAEATVPSPAPISGLASPAAGTQMGQTDLGQQSSEGLATWSVDQATGTFRSAIPFALPSARGSAQPSLSLQYSSHGGIGEGGPGWSLSFPAIERHNPSGPPQYAHDPLTTGGRIDPTQQDSFTYGGSPLVPICHLPEDFPSKCLTRADNGQYASSEHMPSWAMTGGWHYYRLEVESGANLRFFWSPDRQTWVVQSPDGSTMEFGVPRDNSSDLSGTDRDPYDGMPVQLTGACGTSTDTCQAPYTCVQTPYTFTTPSGTVTGKYDRCVPPQVLPIFRWNLVRQYDAARIPGSTSPTNPIWYVWAPLDTQFTGAATRNYLTDIYDTPPVGSGAPALATFAHHTHLRYTMSSTAGNTAAPVWRAAPFERLIGVDVTSQTWNGGGPREQVRRYLLAYGTDFQPTGVASLDQGPALLQHVQVDGWCSTSNPVEDASTFLLPDEPSSGPVCGTLPPTSFSYTRAAAQPSFQTLPITLTTVPTLIDVNADGLTDIVGRDTSTPSANAQTVWLNGGQVGAWMPHAFTMNSPSMGASGCCVSPFSVNYISGPFLNDGHVSAILFDSWWNGTAGSSATSPGVDYSLYSPRPVGSTSVSIASTAFDWGSPIAGNATSLFPGLLKNCKAAWLSCQGQTRPAQDGDANSVSVCAQDNMYVGGDTKYAGVDLDGDGLTDLLVASEYGLRTTVPAGNSTQDGSNYYTGLNAKFSRRGHDGVVVPFATPGPQETTAYASNIPILCFQEQGGGGGSLLNNPNPRSYDTPNILAGLAVDPNTAYPRPIPLVPDNNSTFADVNGDGLPDWVEMYPDHLEIRLGHGNGLFGSCPDGSMLCDAINLGAIERSTTWSPINAKDPVRLNAQFHDVNGDGLDDAIVPTTAGFDVHFNLGGYFNETPLPVNAAAAFGWGSINPPNAPGFDAQYLFADLDSSGVDDVVIVNSNGAVGFVNVVGSPTAPYLLENIAIKGRLETYVLYDNLPSLSSYATAAGHPWKLQSSQSSLVVTQVSTTDLTTGLHNPSHTTKYTYADPVYDARDRAFVGFSSVEVVAPGDASSPTSHVKTTFYQGACNDSTANTCPKTADYSNHALRGLPILTEVYGDGSVLVDGKSQSLLGPALMTTHRRFLETLTYAGMDGRNTHRTNLSQTDTYTYDNAGVVLRGAWQTLLDVAPDNGSAIYQIPFAVTATAFHTRTLHGVDPWGLSASSVDLGQVDANGNSLDGTITNTVTEQPVNDDLVDRWTWRPTLMSVGGTTSQGTTVAPRSFIYFYDSRGNPTFAQTSLTGEVPMYRTTKTTAAKEGGAAPPTGSPSWASQNNSLVTLFIATPDPLGTGNIVRIQQPGTSGCKDFAFDTAYQQLTTAVTTYTGGCGNGGLSTITTQYVRGFAAPTLFSRVDGATSKIDYDAFGRPRAVYRPSALAPSMANPTAAVTIDYGDNLSPRTVHTTVAVPNTGNPATPPTTDVFEVLDGFGRPLLTASTADPSAGDAKAWVVSGQVLRNAKGGVHGVFPPSFQDDWTTVPLMPSGTPSRSFAYDPFGRVISASDFDGSKTIFTLGKIYGSAGYTVQDAEQLKASGPHAGQHTTVLMDGHGRRINVTATGNGGADTTQFQYLPTGELSVLTRTGTDAVTGSAGISYQRWMKYDSLGRMVENIEPSTSTNFALAGTTTSNPVGWTYAYDDAGDLVATSDARGCGKNIAYDGAGRPLYEDYFGCTADHVAYSVPDPNTGAGAEVFYKYNALGQLADVYDRAAHTHYGYSPRGLRSSVQRNLAQPHVIPTPSSGYAPHTFEQDFGYDDLDRIVTETTGEDGAVNALMGLNERSEILLQYSLRGAVSLVAGSYGTLLQQNVIDADGLPLKTVLGDLANTQTVYHYDGRRRLTEQTTSRSAPALWNNSRGASYSQPGPQTTTELLLADDVFTLDDVGNPLAITDGRVSGEWPPEAQPVSRGTAAKPITYDDFYRTTSIPYSYSAANSYKSPTATKTEEPAFPLQSATSRVNFETFSYDPFGNLRARTDDSGLFFDRSLGSSITTDTVSLSPPVSKNRVASSWTGENGSNTVYDAAGNLVSLTVTRAGACESALGCSQLFDYGWDEVGHLARARRWDFPDVYGTHTVCTKFKGQTTCNDVPNPAPTDYTYPNLPPPSHAAAADVSYQYDAGGSRVLRTSAHSGSETYSLEVFDSLRLNGTTFGHESSGDYDRSPQTETLYLVAGGVSYGRVIYDPAAPTLQTGSLAGMHVLFELTDHLGSGSSVIDQETGELVERTTYSAFGRVESDYRPARWDSFRETYKFTGKEEDTALGITYFGARYYSPYLGTWLSPDPRTIHSVAGDLNPYAYVHGAVTSSFDPDGLHCYEDECVKQQQNGGGGTPTEVFSSSSNSGLPDLSFIPNGISNAYNGVKNWVSGWFSDPTPRASVPVAPQPGTLNEMWSAMRNFSFSDLNWGYIADPNGQGHHAIENAVRAADPNLSAFDRLSSGVQAVAAFAPMVGTEAAAEGGLLDVAQAAKVMNQVAQDARAAEQAAQAARALEEAAAICPCFAADTLVDTEDGPKPITDVHEGDRIWAANPETGERALRRVVRRYVTPGKALVEIDTASPGSETTEAIRATPGHPFWVEGKGWVGAAELAPGDRLHTGDGRTVEVVAGHSLEGTETVYNFDVEGWHTYFVGRGDVLVHNGCEVCAGVAEEGGPVLNGAGEPYPTVLHPGTGEPIPEPPAGLTKVPAAERVPWGSQERGAFIKEWYDRGFSTPEGGWAKYDIHHIIPREYGGTNVFENLVPVLRTVHQTAFNPWWLGY